MNKGTKVFFLDRDGVINIDRGYVSKAEQWEWIDGVFDGLKILKKKGFTFAIVTNQSGIGHGYYDESAMYQLHSEIMLPEFEKHGISISATAFCPHRWDEECPCSKPKLGMIGYIEEQVGKIDYPNSWTIGDKEKDVQLGKNIGTQTVLVRSKYWKEGELKVAPNLIVDSLFEAASLIINNRQQTTQTKNERKGRRTSET